MIKQEIKSLIKDSIKRIQEKKEIPVFDIDNIKVERPEQDVHGDYSTNVAMTIAKLSKKNPMEIAELLVGKLRSSDLFDKVEAMRPGFVNFFISNRYLQKQLKKILKEKDKYGENKTRKGKKIMLEYAHPNTHKLFHIGHLRNITNGEALARILQASGYKVIRANYQGDIGLHIAKCLWAMKKTKDLDLKIKSLKTIDEKINFLSKCYVKGNEAYEKDEMAKKEILEVNKKIYNKDTEIVNLWKKTRQWSLDYFEGIYKRVYTHFDRYYFESAMAEKGKRTVFNLEGKVFANSEGTMIFRGSEYGLHDRVFVTKEGNPTYEAKDIALAKVQFKEYNPDLIIHNVGPEQKGYFQVVFKALEEVLPESKDREYHHVSGWVSLKEGKMSSRKGNVIAGEWLLDEVKKRIKKNFKELSDDAAEKIAVGAVKYSFLKNSPSTDMVFDIDESISLQGNSGPYLQYTYVRAKSVLEKSGIKIKELEKSKDFKLEQKQEIALVKLLSAFPDIVSQADSRYAPNLIAGYLFSLCQQFNHFYESLPVLKAENEKLRKARSALVFGVSQIIKNGLNLLGISVLRRM